MKTKGIKKNNNNISINNQTLGGSLLQKNGDNDAVASLTGGAASPTKALGFGVFSEIFNRLSNSLSTLNNSKFFAGLVMLMLNIGSRYYTISLSKTQEEFLRYNLAREFVIFAMAWVGTRDIIISFLITAAFIVLADYLFNEDSNACMIPTEVLQKQKLMRSRLNEDDRITPDKERTALETLEKAQRQKDMEKQVSFVNILQQYQHNLD